MKYDIIIIGAGPGGIFSAYELVKQNADLKIAVFELGNPLEKRRCPIERMIERAAHHGAFSSGNSITQRRTKHFRLVLLAIILFSPAVFLPPTKPPPSPARHGQSALPAHRTAPASGAQNRKSA